MQGILKSNHQRLRDCLQDVKVMDPALGQKLNELEEELCAVFKSYQENMKELKRLIVVYDEKQRSIRHEIKRIKKFSMLVSKKIEKRVLSKAVVIVTMLANADPGSFFY